MRSLTRFVPVVLIEGLARSAGYSVRLARPYAVGVAESTVRGVYWGFRFGGTNVKVGRHVIFDGERLRLGRGIRLHDASHYITGAHGWISIGSGSHIARMSIISGAGGVEIGTNVAIGPHVSVYSSSTDIQVEQLGSVPSRFGTVRVGDNVYIGPGARIVPGVTIGDNAVVAAGAVVTRDVPARYIAKGVPARMHPRSMTVGLEGEPGGTQIKE